MFQVARSCKYILGYDFWSYLLICKSDRCLIFDGCCLGMVDYQETYNWEISQTLPEDFLGFSSQNSPWTQDVTMFSLKQWFGNNTIQGTSTYINVHQRTTQCHTVSQVSWKTVKQSCNAVGLGSTKILKHQNGSKNRIKSTKSDQGSKKNGGNVWKKKTCWAGPRTWCAWSAWTSSVASRSSSKKRVVQNSFFFTHKSKKNVKICSLLL